MNCGSRRLLGGRLIFAMAMMGLSVCASRTAEATCGDYLMMDGHSHSPAVHIATQTPGDPAPPAVPCRGPNCRAHQERAPFAPATPDVERTWDRCCWIAVDAALIADDVAALNCGDGVSIAPWRGEPLFRPPRAA